MQMLIFILIGLCFLRYAAAECAVRAVFAVSERPVAEFGAFMRAQAASVFGTTTTTTTTTSGRVSHFLFLLGQFAVRVLVVAEGLSAEVKRRRELWQKRPKVGM